MAKKNSFENKTIHVQRDIATSKAYWELGNTATKYVLLFLARRQMYRPKGSHKWIIKNNGEIVFPYSEAKSRFGITPPRHTRALKELLEKGFIDIEHPGGGMEGDCTTFSISQRWKQYGQPDFEYREWPKDTRKRGNPEISKYRERRV